MRRLLIAFCLLFAVAGSISAKTPAAGGTGDVSCAGFFILAGMAYQL